ncbi:PepSY domain-containing protein [Synechocystis salina LEGE 06099]|uniref:PepSY domain-containing protein n=1 Tax=Synechocystis salina TaxID=945780 RepID=UPI00187ECB25|nr:PepSY domain-containing protein [Synechocystis salina]MBE9203158.1 PepSY domain-containing protein [Synechocystis salina LEGE 06099]
MDTIKQISYFLAGVVLMEMTLTAAIAKADDRDVTAQERQRIVQVLNAMGCYSFDDAEYEIDKRRFEIDDVVCADGREYEIYLDTSYRVIKTELED